MSNYYSLVKNNILEALNTLNHLTSNTQFEKMHDEIFMRIVNSIHSIVDYYERLDKNIINNEEDLWFRAFSYVNNQIKHDDRLEIIYYPVCGSMFPMSFPMRFGPPGVCWKNFKDNGRKSARGRREHYDKILCDKDIECTLKTILKIIERINKKL